MTLEECHDTIIKAESRVELLTGQKESLEKKVVSGKENLIYLEEAQALFQQVAKETQEQIRYHLEDIVNLALDTVFPGRYAFRIIFEIKRNKTEARIVLMDGEHEIDPMYSNGGGVTDILSFALRIALLMISKNRKLLLLDEPFKFISMDLKEEAFAILKRLSKELGIQIIAVTHDKEMIESADKVFTIKKEKGVSYVDGE